MVGLFSGTFQCVVQTPHGCLLDCKSVSVVLPAHDGMRGILRNHAPMLCRLARGIVEVKEIAGRKDAFFLVNGGFARISENYLIILADDVSSFEGMDQAEIDKMVSDAKSLVVAGAYMTTQTGEDADVDRARLITKMARLSSVDPEHR